MALYPFNFVNRRGIAEIGTSTVTVNDTNVVYTFAPHAFANTWYKGLILVQLPAVPADTTGTLPVVFETNGVSVPLVLPGGDPVTAEDIPGAGVYLVFYDRDRNLLQIINNS